MMISDRRDIGPSEELAVVRPTLNIAEAAELLGVSGWLVRQQVAQGNLPHKRLGRRILIPRARFLAWLEEQNGTGDAPGHPAAS